MKREVEVIGNQFDLNILSQFLTGKDLSIIHEDDRFILKSESLDNSSDSDDEFRGKVIDLLNTVNAVALLYLDSREKLTY
jgi:hypothetical protein